MSPTRYDAVVVGGGVAGLVAARELAHDGASVVVLEAGDRCGGAVRAEDLGGVRVDVGAEAYALTRPDAQVLVEELGLGEQVVEPARADPRLWYGGRAHPMPVTALGVPTDLADPALLALVGEDGVRRAAALDAAAVPAYDPGVSLGALVRDRLGDAVVRAVVDPLVAGVHSASADAVGADAVLPGLVAAVAEHSGLVAAAASRRPGSRAPLVRGLVGGMTVLVEAVLADLRARGVAVRTGTGAHWLEGRQPPWTVVADRPYVADRVVLAVPAPRAAELTRPLAVPADVARLSTVLATVPVVPTVVVALLVRSAGLAGAPVGSGVLVAPGDPDVGAKALTHASAKWAWLAESVPRGTEVLRLSYAPAALADRDPVAVALADAARLTGCALEPVAARVTPWPQTMVAPTGDGAAHQEVVRRAAAPYAGLAVVGAGLGGNGLAGTVAHARATAHIRA